MKKQRALNAYWKEHKAEEMDFTIGEDDENA